MRHIPGEILVKTILDRVSNSLRFLNDRDPIPPWAQVTLAMKVPLVCLGGPTPNSLLLLSKDVEAFEAF